MCVVWLEGNDYLTPMREKFGDQGNFGCHTLKESRKILSTLMKIWKVFLVQIEHTCLRSKRICEVEVSQVREFPEEKNKSTFFHGIFERCRYFTS